ncbi:MAG: hypothetical protein NTW49_07785 [Bacteroidia bacterium]|nr:hypothetical protein [Bacteroidia bacterium]
MLKEKMSQNLEYVKGDFDNLLNLYRNKYILVNEQQVVGSFDTYNAAAEEGVNNYGIEGSFLVYFMSETTPVNFISTAAL